LREWGDDKTKQILTRGKETGCSDGLRGVRGGRDPKNRVQSRGKNTGELKKMKNGLFLLGVFLFLLMAPILGFSETFEETEALAEGGDASAQYSLGTMYYKGEGVPKDYQKAGKWFQKAAEQEDAKAQYNLGVMYFKGKSVQQDYVQAHMWFNLAATNGLEDAAKARQEVTLLMTPQQIAEAQKLARKRFKKGQKK
jgi:TPR repeat protein